MQKQQKVLTEITTKVFLLLLIAALPFIVLIRGSVYLHTHYHFYPLASILGGFFLTCIILLLYHSFFYGPARSIKSRLRSIAIVLIAYAGYTLLYVHARNLKTPELAREFRSLHPVLRLGVSTILLLDGDLVITDANRNLGDYVKMGLKNNNQSLHFRQTNGYVHAMDVRTRGRSGIRNFLMKCYFRGIGFRVIQHGGTGDHLHISLISHDRPYAL